MTPVSVFSVTSSIAAGRQIYPGTNFGLRNADSRVYSLGFDYMPIDKVSMGATYGYEHYTALEASRSANPLPANTIAFLNDPTQQFNDPSRDWTDGSADHVHTANVSVDFIKLIPRTDIKLAYDYSRAESTYTYGLAPNTVLAAPVQLTPVINELQRGTVDGRYFVAAQSRARPGVLLRQVPRRRLRPEPGEQPGAARHRDARPHDARLLLPSVHREQRHGADHVPLVTRRRAPGGQPPARRSSRLTSGDHTLPPLARRPIHAEKFPTRRISPHFTPPIFTPS